MVCLFKLYVTLWRKLGDQDCAVALLIARRVFIGYIFRSIRPLTIMRGWQGYHGQNALFYHYVFHIPDPLFDVAILVQSAELVYYFVICLLLAF